MSNLCRFRRVLASVLAGTGVAALAAADDELKGLLEGVREIAAPGLPGQVCVFATTAFPVITGKASNTTQGVVVAAAHWDRGRVAVFGHNGYFGEEALATADTGRLLRNLVLWCGDKPSPRVGFRGLAGAIPYLGRQGIAVRELKSLSAPGDLQDVEVLVATPGDLGEADARAVEAFIRQGGGFVSGETGWGWLQLHPGRTLLADHAGNRLLAKAGLVWADGGLNRTGTAGFAVSGPPPRLTHVAWALDALEAQAGAQALDKADQAQAAWTLTHAVRSIPSSDELLLPRLRRLVEAHAAQAVPLPGKPLTLAQPLGRLALTLQLEEMARLPVDRIRAHPAAATFPGLAPAEARPVSRVVTVDTAAPGWHSTGLYAAPGALISVRVPPNAAAKGLAVRIGSTTCRNWGHDVWARAPEIDRQYPVTTAESQAANAFGGLVYIVVPDGCDLGVVDVTVANAVEAPFYELGKTGAAQWRDTIRNRPGPMAELASEKVILTVPSTAIRALDDPEALMRLWDRILDACAELAAYPTSARRRPERYSADLQICAGYMHAGYPLMVPTSTAADLVNRELLQTRGDWGFFHEMGHNHQSADWTFDGTGEVTVNLFTLYVLDRVCGIDPAKGRMAEGTIRNAVTRYFRAGPDFGRWKSDPFLALVMYVQVQQAFGWEAYRKVFAEYRQLPPDQRPRSDQEKRDQWLTRLSRTVGHDLGPLFEAWAVPTSEPARTAVRGLPAWLPPEFPPKAGASKRAAPNARVLRVSSETEGDEAANALDGYDDTIWHSRWRGGPVPAFPHEITIDLGQALSICGITLLPRQDGGDNGWISDYEVYTSADPDSWGEPVAKGTFAKSRDKKDVRFATPRSCRYLRFVARKGFDGKVWASMAELDVIPAE